MSACDCARLPARLYSSCSRHGSSARSGRTCAVAEIGTETLSAGANARGPVLVFLLHAGDDRAGELPWPAVRPSSSCTWPRSSTTTSSTVQISAVGGRPRGPSTVPARESRRRLLLRAGVRRAGEHRRCPRWVVVLAEALRRFARRGLQRRQAGPARHYGRRVPPAARSRRASSSRPPVSWWRGRRARRLRARARGSPSRSRTTSPTAPATSTRPARRPGSRTFATDADPAAHPRRAGR